jgi:hypothetical protein
MCPADDLHHPLPGRIPTDVLDRIESEVKTSTLHSELILAAAASFLENGWPSA